MEKPQMEKLVLIGAGGHGRDVLDAARMQGRAVLGFIDQDATRHGAMVNGVPVLGGLEWLLEHFDVEVILTVGGPKAKKDLAGYLDANHVKIAAPVVHPQAYISRDAKIGDGVVVLAGSTIQPQAIVGRHGAVSTVSTIGHDVIVGEFASIHPGTQIGGETTIGVGAFVGIGATILPRVRIGSWTTVGAGAVVIADLPEQCTAVGVPARVIKYHETTR